MLSVGVQVGAGFFVLLILDGSVTLPGSGHEYHTCWVRFASRSIRRWGFSSIPMEVGSWAGPW